MLVFGHWHNVSRRVALKVPPSAVEDVTADVLVSAIQSAFDGVSAGEFVGLAADDHGAADRRLPPPAGGRTVPLEDVELEAPEAGVVVARRTRSTACWPG